MRAAQQRGPGQANKSAITQLLTLRAIGAIRNVGARDGNLRVASRSAMVDSSGGAGGVGAGALQSGETEHDQGMTGAGDAHVRRVIVQLAWGWLHHQPTSALSLWYQRRVGGGGRRMRRWVAVALARKLLIALWRYLETGLPP